MNVTLFHDISEIIEDSRPRAHQPRPLGAPPKINATTRRRERNEAQARSVVASIGTFHLVGGKHSIRRVAAAVVGAAKWQLSKKRFGCARP
jgi:hypothetical protein